MGASQWAADYLTRHPILLDELLDARVLLAEPDWAAWRTELARMLAEHAGDAERQMDALRHFQHAQTFRLLAQDLAGTLTVERLADHLSALADVILEATLAEVWAHMEGRRRPPPRFAIIGYGKLGGKELGYASDLDLVFLYDDEADETALDRYTRLARRLITWLTSDDRRRAALRHRPAAAARRRGGPPVVVARRLPPLRARAGVDLGAPGAHARAIRRRRRDDRRGVRGRARGDPVHAARSREARGDVVDMRRRMLAGHANPTPLFDLKHDPGGMVDVEFAVQYLVLAHAHEHADAHAQRSATSRSSAWPPTWASFRRRSPAAAADAYRDYRRLQHQIRLTGAARRASTRNRKPSAAPP